MDLEIEPQELARMREAKEDFFLLDVREPLEYQTARIEGSTLIPMGQVPGRAAEIPRDKPIVVHCHHGGRSMQIVRWLQRQGIDASNLSGGIDRWSLEVDPKVPRY